MELPRRGLYPPYSQSSRTGITSLFMKFFCGIIFKLDYYSNDLIGGNSLPRSA
jgi:hypothetical protein